MASQFEIRTGYRFSLDSWLELHLSIRLTWISNPLNHSKVFILSEIDRQCKCLKELVITNQVIIRTVPNCITSLVNHSTAYLFTFTKKFSLEYDLISTPGFPFCIHVKFQSPLCRYPERYTKQVSFQEIVAVVHCSCSVHIWLLSLIVTCQALSW